MKTKSKTVLAIVIVLGIHFIPKISIAQWEVGGNFSLALPITGYGEVFKIGHGFGVEGKYHFKKGLGIGFESGFARFVKTKESLIQVSEPKTTVVPIIFTAEHEINKKGFFRPFVAGGLGLSIYTFSYYISDPVESKNRANVSFTMSPQAGIRFALTKNFIPHVKGSYVLLMDGPPAVIDDSGVLIAFPKSNQATGYGNISFGFNYRFN